MHLASFPKREMYSLFTICKTTFLYPTPARRGLSGLHVHNLALVNTEVVSKLTRCKILNVHLIFCLKCTK